jgi:hypothetical protein
VFRLSGVSATLQEGPVRLVRAVTGRSLPVVTTPQKTKGATRGAAYPDQAPELS